MKILLTGASGLLGSAFARAAIRRRHEVIGLTGSFEGPLEGLAQQRKLDLNDLTQLERTVLEVFPDAIVNCAAISDPADCEADPESSSFINVTLPEKLALLSRHFFARFIHLSSEQVFDGTSAPYRVSDTPRPTTVYSTQKLESEQKVLEMTAEFASVIRIPLLNGNSPRGTRSLHEKLFASWSKGNRTNLFHDEYRQPCLADNLADAMVEICERDDSQGLLHWGGAERLSRFEIGKRILEHFGLPATLINESSRKDHDAHSGRQADLALDLQPLVGKLKTRPQPFSLQLESLIVPKPFRDWYNSI